MFHLLVLHFSLNILLYLFIEKIFRKSNAPEMKKKKKIITYLQKFLFLLVFSLVTATGGAYLHYALQRGGTCSWNQ